MKHETLIEVLANEAARMLRTTLTSITTPNDVIPPARTITISGHDGEDVKLTIATGATLEQIIGAMITARDASAHDAQLRIDARSVD